MTRVLSPFLLSLLLACGGSAPAGSKVDQAITVARELRAKPDDAEKILAEHKMTAEQWEALMFEIADDPALAAQYEAGLQK